MFNNVKNARDQGVNLLFLSGNSLDGIQYLSPSTDNRPFRTTGRMPEREYKNEQDLMGSSSWGVGYGSYICQKPEHWMFEGTGMKKGDSIPNLIGWEYHGRPAGNIPNLEILAETKVDALSFGDDPQNHLSTFYTTPKGNYVFNAGTCFWVLPLAKTPAYQHPKKMRQDVDFSKPDPRVQQMTRNLFNKAITTGP
jgi:hypothetical protein